MKKVEGFKRMKTSDGQPEITINLTSSSSSTTIDNVNFQGKSWKYMYKQPPLDNLTLQQFVSFSLDRLTLLNKIETSKARRSNKRDEFHKEVAILDLKYLGKCGESNVIDDYKDYVSHHILRLAFAKNEQLHFWFLNLETTLFESRLVENMSNCRHVLQNVGIDLDEVTDRKERLEITKGLEVLYKSLIFDTVIPGQTPVGLFKIGDYTPIWKIKWTKVLSLVASKKALIKKGNVYLIEQKLVELLVQMFREKLQEALVYIQPRLRYLDGEEDRLVSILNIIRQKKSTGENAEYHSVNYNQLEAHDVEKVSVCFPLCMKNLYSHLQQNHHLKHQGRLQFGLFLKGIGLTVEAALQFWREEFTKSITDTDFDKQYSYNFRHQFGMEGKKTSYSPFGCQKIILGPVPKEGEYHGCPFKHFDRKVLQRTLENVIQSKEAIQEIMGHVEQQTYQMACAKYFEVLHPNRKNPEELVVIKHPNQYFDKSKAILRANIGNSNVGSSSSNNNVSSGPSENVVGTSGVDSAGGQNTSSSYSNNNKMRDDNEMVANSSLMEGIGEDDLNDNWPTEE